MGDLGEESLRESEKRFRELFENAGDFVYTTDLTGTFTAINRAGEQLTGYPREEVVGTNIARVVAPEHLSLLMQMTDPEAGGSAPATYELEIITKGGRRVPLEVSTRTIYRNGRPAGSQGIARDITWRKHADDEIRRRAAHLEVLNAIIAAADAAPDLPSLLELAIDRTLSVVALGLGGIWVGSHSAVRGFDAGIGKAVVDGARNRGTDPAVPLVVEDWRAAADAEGTWWARLGVRASVTAPIVAEGGCIGALVVASPRPRPWPAEEVALVEAVAQQVGATAEALRLFRETQQRAELMGRLISLSETLNRPSSLTGILTAIGQAALSLSGANGVAVYLRRPDGSVNCAWSHGVSSQYIARVLAPEVIRAWLALTGRAQTIQMDLPGGDAVSVPGPTFIQDIEALSADDIVRRLAEEEGVRALTAWPLTYEGRVFASVSCYYNAPRPWSRPEREAMQTFTWQAAAALQNARLFEAQSERTEELEALYNLSSRLRSAPTPEEMYPVLVDQAMRLLHADHGALALLNDDETFTRVHTTGVPLEVTGSTFPVSGSLSGRVMQTGEPYVTDDFSKELLPGQLYPSHDWYRALGPLAVVALKSEREVIGTLVVGRAHDQSRRAFTETEIRLLQGIAEMGGTAIRRGRLYHNLQQSYIQMVLSLARAMDARDAYTGNHSERLAAWADAVARALGRPEEEIQDIRWGALLHDIGKIGVPDSILRKPGLLDEEEWLAMRRHPLIGETILLPVARMQRVALIVRHHQERWDGTGYPDRLRGYAIPLGARILAVVDAYGVITDDRPYKQARSHADGVAELRRGAGLQFDPAIVDVFCRLLERGLKGPNEARLFA